MELNSGEEELTFSALQRRLLAFVNARIQNGEFSERSLAKQMGISQPQLHNVLKGARNLHVPLSDAFLRFFKICVPDLLSPAELGTDNDLMNAPRMPAAEESHRLGLLRKLPGSSSTSGPSKREVS
ncbi:MAG: hypothetical protein M3Y72_25915 [Acidobacteriota bacterium]|nr:hypothetical protein [Acidobacteriota bacterium]